MILVREKRIALKEDGSCSWSNYARGCDAFRRTHWIVFLGWWDHEVFIYSIRP